MRPPERGRGGKKKKKGRGRKREDSAPYLRSLRTVREFPREPSLATSRVRTKSDGGNSRRVSMTAGGGGKKKGERGRGKEREDGHDALPSIALP